MLRTVLFATSGAGNVVTNSSSSADHGTTARRHRKAIQSTLGTFGIAALRADDKEYHDDLLPNVLTYIYGCRFGIAVFERLEAEDFNPNVSLEVGYMRHGIEALGSWGSNHRLGGAVGSVWGRFVFTWRNIM